MQGKQVYFVYIARNFLDFFKIEMLSGRNFSGSEIEGLYSRRDASKALIINASACQAFGISSPEKAVGTMIYHDDNPIGHVTQDPHLNIRYT